MGAFGRDRILIYLYLSISILLCNGSLWTFSRYFASKRPRRERRLLPEEIGSGAFIHH